MKKLLCVLLCLLTILSFVACNAGEQPSETTGNQTTTEKPIDAPNDDLTEDLPEAFAGMYTKENATGTECFVIYDNNEVLKLGQTRTMPAISNDGKFLIYIEMSEQQINLYTRQAQGEPVLIAENAYFYSYDSATGVLLAETKDGIYYTKDLTAPAVKIPELDANLSNSTFIVSLDGNSMLVRNPKNELYSVSLSKDFAISELGKAGKCKAYFVSNEEVFYLSEGVDSKAYIIAADGAVTEMDYSSYHVANNILAINKDGEEVSYIFSKQFGMQSLGTYNMDAVVSANGKYVAYADDSKVHHFEITADGLTNEKTVDGTYKVHAVSDTGAVLLSNQSNHSFGILEGSAVKVLSKQDANKGTVAFVDDTAYYVCGNQLFSYNAEKEPAVIATGVSEYYVLDSGCYYIGTDNALHLVGLDSAVDTEVSAVYAY